MEILFLALLAFSRGYSIESLAPFGWAAKEHRNSAFRRISRRKALRYPGKQETGRRRKNPDALAKFDEQFFVCLVLSEGGNQRLHRFHGLEVGHHPAQFANRLQVSRRE